MIATKRDPRSRAAFLGNFITAQESTSIGDWWSDLLGVAPTIEIRRLLAEGLLTDVPLVESIVSSLQATALKAQCRTLGLKVSGRKDELARRLVAADPVQSEALLNGRRFLMCTEPARIMAEQYRLEVTVARSNAARRAMEALAARDFRAAAREIAACETKQLQPRGVGIRWTDYDTHPDVIALAEIFSRVPGILKGINPAAIEPLRIAAGMTLLTGEREQVAAVPDPGITLTREVCARMFLFLGYSKRNLMDYRASGVVRGVELSASNDSCAFCRGYDGRKYSLNFAPELPHPGCTHEMGCRCGFAPVVAKR